MIVAVRRVDRLGGMAGCAADDGPGLRLADALRMRPFALVVAVLSIVTAFVAATSIAILENLGQPATVLVEPLVRGDLWPLLSSGHFWSTFPMLPAGSVWFSGPAIAVAGGAALLWPIARRRPQWSPTMLAAAALALAVPLWLVGWLPLRANTDPAECGPWLAWMVAGPLYASVLALVCLGTGWPSALRQRASAAMAPVPAIAD